MGKMACFGGCAGHICSLEHDQRGWSGKGLLYISVSEVFWGSERRRGSELIYPCGGGRSKDSVDEYVCGSVYVVGVIAHQRIAYVFWTRPCIEPGSRESRKQYFASLGWPDSEYVLAQVGRTLILSNNTS